MNVVIYPNNSVCIDGKLLRDIDSERFLKKHKIKPKGVYDYRTKIKGMNLMIFRKKENDLRAI